MDAWKLLTSEEERLKGRRVCQSASEISELALPNDANPLGYLIGGRVMHLVDIAGAIAATRHARSPVVTASVDYMTFLHPIQIGQLVTVRSTVNRAWNTSMEVGVKVICEDLMTGEVRHTTSAYLTFVAVDGKGGKLQVAPILPESEEEIRRFEDAGKRRAYRLEMKLRLTETKGG